MAKLDVCSACGGFVPAQSLACPHCRRRTRTRLALALGGTIGGGAVAFTLMACYGVAPICPGDTAGTGDCSFGEGGSDDGATHDARPDVHVAHDADVDAAADADGDRDADADARTGD